MCGWIWLQGLAVNRCTREALCRTGAVERWGGGGWNGEEMKNCLPPHHHPNRARASCLLGNTNLARPQGQRFNRGSRLKGLNSVTYLTVSACMANRHAVLLISSLSCRGALSAALKSARPSPTSGVTHCTDLAGRITSKLCSVVRGSISDAITES